MSVVGGVNIEAFLSVVHDVVWSRIPSDLILVDSGVWSDGNSDIDSESSSELVCNAVVSLLEGSDSLGSCVEDEPLVDIIWVVPVNSDSVLVSSNVLGGEHCQVVQSFNLGSDLELNATLQWLFWIVPALSVESPSLVSSLVALVPVNMSLVGV